MFALHNLTGNVSRKSRKRVGRGTGNNWGKTCGRGQKGQMARGGSVRRLHFEGGQIPLFRRLPKKGFRSPNPTRFSLVNLKVLERNFEENDTVDQQSLQKKGILKKAVGGFKILGEGSLTKSLHIKADHFSKAAREKVEIVGGSCTIT